MGCAFTYPIFRYLAQCPVSCYTHYPVITSTMMRRVKHRITTYNNRSVIARNPILTWCKLLYYKIFGWVCIKFYENIFCFLHLVYKFTFENFTYTCTFHLHIVIL